MPVKVIEQQLPTLAWPPGDKSAVWFLQPRLHVDPAIRPYLHRTPDGNTAPLELLRAACAAEQSRHEQAGSALFLLPEFAVAPDETEALRALIKGCPERFLFVVGLGQMSPDQARGVEDRPELWETPSPGTVTNCAAVGIGKSDTLYLQPKIVASGPERDHHWPGAVVRYFHGEHSSFAVLICSDLYARPEDQTTLLQVLDALDSLQRKLRLLIWIQHNEKPRSAAFARSIQQLSERSPSTTAFLACSRADRPCRVDNYSVSGALVPHAALPKRFRDLDRRFHYVEPVAETQHARVVLLRYDADAYRVNTVLADTLTATSGVAKSALFEFAEPYVLNGQRLEPCNQHHHLRDLSERAVAVARGISAAVSTHADGVRDEIVRLETPAFLRLLDLSTLPRGAPPNHPPNHEPGFLCRCWPHRECIDNLAHDASAVPLALVFFALAALRAEGLTYDLLPDVDAPVTCRVYIDSKKIYLRLIDTGDLTLDGIRTVLLPSETLLSPHLLVLLGSATAPPSRPSAGTIDAGVAEPFGALRASNARAPLPPAIYRTEFWSAYETRRLGPTLLERVGVGLEANE